MLPKKYRLTKRKSFNYIYRKGHSVGNGEMTLIFCYAKMSDTPLRIGFSVSKKVGCSVVRHTVARKMRAATNPILTRINANNNLIFVAKESITKLSVAEIQNGILSLLAKANLLGK
jgi:ribonuclease P protein component